MNTTEQLSAPMVPVGSHRKPLPARLSHPLSPSPNSAMRSGLLLLTLTVSILGLLLCLLSSGGQADVVPTPLRAGLAALMAYTLPGAPVALLLRLRGLALNVIVACPVSLSVTVLVAQSQMVTGHWTPIAAELLIIAVSLALAVTAMIRSQPWTTPFRPRLDLRLDRRQAIGLALVAAALISFAVATATVDVARADAIGIIGQVGPWYLIALLLSAVAIVFVFSATVFHQGIAFVVVGATMVITAMLTGLALRTASFPTAYIHRGLIEILNADGHLPPPSDARFSWAGFFSGSAQLVSVAGLRDAGQFLLWAPVINTLAMFAPLFLIGFVITRSRRIAWAGIAVYILFNWYQQDYFSPQGMATFLYSSVVALLLWQLTTSRIPTTAAESELRRIGDWVASMPVRRPAERQQWWARRPALRASAATISSVALTAVRRTPGRQIGATALRTLAFEAILVLLLAALVVSHQLTPMVTVAAIGIFTLAGYTRYRLLWVIGLGLFIAWFSFGASDYWIGHIHEVLGDVGKVDGAVSAGVADRLGADPTYQNFQYLRLLTSGTLAVLAVIGWLAMRRRRGRLVVGVLSALPLGLIAVQSYGGEVIIRCFVLASPMLAPLAGLAVAMGWRATRRRSLARGSTGWVRFVPRCVAVGLVFVSMIAVVTDRGLNTSFEYTTRQQDRIGSAFLRNAVSGTLIMAWGAAPTLVSPRLYTEVEVTRVDSLQCLADLVGCTLDRDPNFVFTTVQSRSSLVYQYGYAGSTVDTQLAKVVQTGKYTTMFDDDGVIILRRLDTREVAVK